MGKNILTKNEIKQLFLLSMNTIQDDLNMLNKFSQVINVISDSTPVIFGSKLKSVNTILTLISSFTGFPKDFLEWWLWEDVEKIVYIDNGNEKLSYPVPDLNSLFDFLWNSSKNNLLN